MKKNPEMLMSVAVIALLITVITYCSEDLLMWFRYHLQQGGAVMMLALLMLYMVFQAIEFISEERKLWKRSLAEIKEEHNNKVDQWFWENGLVRRKKVTQWVKQQ